MFLAWGVFIFVIEKHLKIVLVPPVYLMFHCIAAFALRLCSIAVLFIRHTWSLKPRCWVAGSSVCALKHAGRVNPRGFYLPDDPEVMCDEILEIAHFTFKSLYVHSSDESMGRSLRFRPLPTGNRTSTWATQKVSSPCTSGGREGGGGGGGCLY